MALNAKSLTTIVVVALAAAVGIKYVMPRLP
jgi:hypothetical protein